MFKRYSRDRCYVIAEIGGNFTTLEQAKRLIDLAAETGADAVGVDWAVDLKALRARLPASVVTQGNLHPETLIAGGEALDAAVDAIREATAGTAHIFNLGHGITPQTPIAHVERMLARLRG